jgi:hypothetical protein
MRETRNEYRIFVDKPLRQPRKLEHNIRVDLREMNCEDRRWMELV